MVRGAGSRKGKESDMYTFDSRVRYSETDEEGNLSVVGIMNYLQDCSTFQSEDLKLGISYLNEEKRAWWLSGACFRYIPIIQRDLRIVNKR